MSEYIWPALGTLLVLAVFAAFAGLFYGLIRLTGGGDDPYIDYFLWACLGGFIRFVWDEFRAIEKKYQ